MPGRTGREALQGGKDTFAGRFGCTRAGRLARHAGRHAPAVGPVSAPSARSDDGQCFRQHGQDTRHGSRRVHFHARRAERGLAGAGGGGAGAHLYVSSGSGSVSRNSFSAPATTCGDVPAGGSTAPWPAAWYTA